MASTTKSGPSKRVTTRPTATTRGASEARRRLRRTRMLVEREPWDRRRSVETFRHNRRRLEREVRLVCRDIDKQSDTLTGRIENMLGEPEGRVSSVV